nr:DUF6442 family protein [Lachnospiraceae bacterium]
MEKLGLFIIFVIVLCVILLFTSILKSVDKPGHYDEMQEVYRTRANKYGFFGMVILLLIYIFYDMFASAGSVRLSASILAIATLTLGSTITVFYSLIKGAYYQIGQKITGNGIIFLVLGIMNLLIFIMEVREERDFVENGLMIFKNCYAQLMVGILFSAIGIGSFVNL